MWNYDSSKKLDQKTVQNLEDIDLIRSTYANDGSISRSKVNSMNQMYQYVLPQQYRFQHPKTYEKSAIDPQFILKKNKSSGQ